MTWLRGDMHNHCEKPELLEEHLRGIERLDFAALTNHAQKPVFFSQHEMIARGREGNPEFPLLFGMEWNAAGGRHANIIFPPSPEESAHAYAFSRAHDRHVEGSDPDIGRAMQQLAQIDPPPVLFFNHPEPDDWSTEVLDQYLESDHDPVRIAVGLEAVPGHQAQPRSVRLDHDHFPGCAVGGLADHVYEKGIPLALLAHSDFHVHKQEKEYDYPLGMFNHTRVGVRGESVDADGILGAIRAGRTCACQGHWLDLTDFSISSKDGTESALIGDCWSGEKAARLTIALDTTEALESVDVIGRFGTTDPTSIVRRFGPQPVGAMSQVVEIPAGARGHVRLRVISKSHQRPAPGQVAPKAFFTSAILLGAKAV